MLKVFYFLAVFILVSIVNPHSLSAQDGAPEKPTCLERVARKIPHNKEITVVRPGGEKLTGRLESVDLAQSHLTMVFLGPKDTNPTVYRISEFSKIQYNAGGRLKHMMLGLLIGGGIGALIGLSQEGEGCDFLGDPTCIEGFETATGAILGGAGGLLIGFALPTTRTIECK